VNDIISNLKTKLGRNQILIIFSRSVTNVASNVAVIQMTGIFKVEGSWSGLLAIAELSIT